MIFENDVTYFNSTSIDATRTTYVGTKDLNINQISVRIKLVTADIATSYISGWCTTPKFCWK